MWSLDVNFINPYKTADFLFFDGKEDAKKTDNSVVKVKGCLIDAHVDINNLPPFPSDYQILIVLQCDDQLGKVDHGENNPAQK